MRCGHASGRENETPPVLGTRGSCLRGTTQVRPRSRASPARAPPWRLSTSARHAGPASSPTLPARNGPAIQPAASEPCSARRPHRLAPFPGSLTRCRGFGSASSVLPLRRRFDLMLRGIRDVVKAIQAPVVGQFALVLFGDLGLLNHAEEVTIGIFQHDKVSIRGIPPGIASRPDLD